MHENVRMNIETTFSDSLNVAELVQIAGLVRFSYPCEGGFRRQFRSRSEQLATLFSEQRMEERFKFFETLCLHGLKHQTAKDFTVGVLIGEDIPAVYRVRMEALLAGLPQARLIALPVLPYQQAIRQAFVQLFDQEKPFRMSFRLDDDDAVAVDFIEQVITKLPQLTSLSGGLDPVGLSFLKGMTLSGPPDARRLSPAVDAKPLGLGLCVMAPQSSNRNALLYAHVKMHMNMPMVTDPFPMMNLRSFHTSNDSVLRLPAGQPIGMKTSEIREVLWRRFALEMNAVLAL